MEKTKKKENSTVRNHHHQYRMSVEGTRCAFVFLFVCACQALVGYGQLAMMVNQVDKGLSPLLKAIVLQQVQ